MSIAVMDRVWRCSKAAEGKLLVLLAIGDFANDGGEAWPSIPTLAKKSRLSDRQTQRVINALVHLGELKISKNKGPHGCHRYQIIVAETGGDKMSPVTKCRGDMEGARGDMQGTLGVTQLCHPNRHRTINKNRHSPSQAQSPPSPAIADSGENPSSSSKSAKGQKSARLKEISLLPSQAGLEFADWFRSTLPESFSLAESWREEWGRAFDALVRNKRTPEEIWRVSKWARADSFWKSSFLSPLKLRRRNQERVAYFDAFSAQMNGRKPRRPKPQESFI